MCDAGRLPGRAAGRLPRLCCKDLACLVPQRQAAKPAPKTVSRTPGFVKHEAIELISTRPASSQPRPAAGHALIMYLYT